MLMLIVALVIALLVMLTRKDVAYTLVIIWALTGIAVKQSANQNILIATEVSIIILLITLIASLLHFKLKL